MKKYIPFSLLVILSTMSPIFGLETEDQKSINHIIEHFTNAWNYHAGQGSADHYADDADFVNIFGTAFAGKQEIEARHVKIHESFLKNSLLEVTNLRLREVKPEIVIAHVYWKVTNIPKPMKGIFTHVFLKNDGKWEIVATQNTPISN